MDKYPLCSKQHFYEKVWSSASPPVSVKMLSTHLTSCPTFVAMPPDQKTAAVSAQAACLHCTAWDHSSHQIPGGKEIGDPTCKVKVGGVECGLKHGKWFHPTQVISGTTGAVVLRAQGMHVSVSTPALYEVVCAQLQGENQTEEDAMVMVDPGSDTDFVRHDIAQRLGLVGERIKCYMQVVDRECKLLETLKYQIRMVDKDGIVHSFPALGVKSITTLPDEPSLTPLAPLLSGYPAEVLQRPQGQVGILLGLRTTALHGKFVEEWGCLRMLCTPFGCGFVV